jgi:hypothetical protein
VSDGEALRSECRITREAEAEHRGARRSGHDRTGATIGAGPITLTLVADEELV